MIEKNKKGNYDMDNNNYNNIDEANDMQQINNFQQENIYEQTYYQQPNQNINIQKNKKKSNGLFKKAVAFTVCGALFGGAAGGTFTLVDNYFNKSNDKEIVQETETTTDTIEEVAEEVSGKTTEESPVSIPTTTTLSDGEIDSQSLDVSDIAENVMPSVVAITIKAVTEYDMGFFGGTYEYESEGSGSGIIIGTNEKELLIVTNNHVVSGAETVSVCFIDEQVYEANVKGTDSDNDLAIIAIDLAKISADTMASIKVATIGDSSEIKVGEQVVAIGNALGYGQSVTTGIVSAKDRVVSTNTTPLIQTDAAINPGNSGGALLNMKGEVIGINSSKYMSTEVEGMGYAIPISEVEDILDELMNRETREKVDENEVGYLGVGCATVDEQASYVSGIPMGALVSEVMEGSPAHKSGIKKNNIIVEFDGVEISSAEQLVDLLEYYRAGEKVVVTVAYLADEDYVEKEIEVVLGRRATSISE